MKSGATLDFTTSKFISLINGKRMKLPALSVSGFLNGGFSSRRRFVVGVSLAIDLVCD